LIPHLEAFASESSRTEVSAIISGEGELGDRMLRALPSVRARRDPSGRVARRFEIETVPFALLYRNGRLAAKGVVNDKQMLETLEQGLVRAHGDDLLRESLERDAGHRLGGMP
jgi:hypothetical protein